MISISNHALLQILKRVCEKESQVLYIKDRNGRYIYTNPIVLKSFQLSEKEVFGKTDLEISQEENIKANHEEDLQLISSKKFLTKAESYLKIELCESSLVSKELILDDSSEVIALCCFLQNCNLVDPISQLAITNFENNHLLGIWILNLYTFKFSISHGLAKILGIEPYAVLTFPDYVELTDPEDKPYYERCMVDAIQERKNFFLERKILNFLKEEKVLLESISAYPLDNYDLEHIYGIVLDITDSYARKKELEKKKLEHEIQIKAQAKELVEAIQTKNKLLLKYQAFLNSLGEVSYERNLLTDEIKWSGETEKLLGYSPSEMPTKWNSYLELIHSDDLEKVLSDLNLLKASQSSYSVEYRMKTSSNSYKWILDKGYRVKDGDIPTEAVGIIRDIHELKTSAEKMKELAYKDELTGIYNRRGIFQLLEKNFFQAQRYGLRLELYYCDLNDFKKINDELGHDMGDSALVDFANILKKTLRKSDVLGRVGGDEFIFFAISNHPKKSNNVEDRLRKAVDDFNQKMGRPYKLSFSLGRVEYDSILHVTPDDLITEADFMMYQNKRVMKGNLNSLEKK